MKKLIIANWKLNPPSAKEAVSLARAITRNIEITKYRNVEVVVAPPVSFFIPVGAALKKAVLGAQNVFWEDAGPYTGEISPSQLRNLKVKYVIIGHSERRLNLGETDEMVNKKVRSVLEKGLGAIVCVGERERESDNAIPPVVGEQIRAALAGVRRQFIKNLTVAYEPVWAISTTAGNGGADTPDRALRARIYIEKILSALYSRPAVKNVRIIYGGSVDAANIASFLDEGGMDGALVGGASLNPKEFAAIIRRAAATLNH